MTTTPAAAYQAARVALRDAPAFTDPDLSAQGTVRRRAEMIRAAKAQLIGAMPTLPEGVATRAEVLAARTPTTADAVVVQGREREKVTELRNAGLTFAQIAGEASEVRVAALIDAVEGIAAAEPEQASELEELLFSRLVGLGAADAIEAHTAEQETVVGTAWRDALASTIENRDPDLRTRTQLHSADRPRYDIALANDVAVDWAAVARIEAAHPAE
ncbi:hypothetical protein [Microbacterium sp. SA39]|uniref:hypothetical protein n=1 Tax=Microbacterium sp. SA39 TaxID=1263625 RepID=UPI00061F27A9|nr:hypothetical protein [Microbacterium sp. SA39]KJQ53715.1 hypothetical protein RS85_02265 [Microbacterium sp. SA39]